MDAIHETLIAAIRSALSAAGYEKGSCADTWSPHVRELIAAQAAYEKAAAAPVGYTVFLQEAGNTETTHVTYHEVGTIEDAIAAAHNDLREDWEQLELTAACIHTLGVAAGDVTLVHWEDQA